MGLINMYCHSQKGLPVPVQKPIHNPFILALYYFNLKIEFLYNSQIRIYLGMYFCFVQLLKNLITALLEVGAIISI